LGRIKVGRPNLTGNDGMRMTIPKTSSRLVWFFGFMFFGLATFDVMRHRLDVMTYTFLFFGLLAFAVASCLQNIEKRLTSIEQSLSSPR
jgi:hypothetical protein